MQNVSKENPAIFDDGGKIRHNVIKTQIFREKNCKICHKQYLDDFYECLLYARLSFPFQWDISILAYLGYICQELFRNFHLSGRL